jgi:hypothetical protein
MLDLLKRYAELAPEEIRLAPRGTSTIILCSPATNPIVINVAVDGPQESMVDIAVLGIVLKSFADRQKANGSRHEANLAIYSSGKNFEMSIGCDGYFDLICVAEADSPGLAALIAYVEYLESPAGRC